MKKLYKRDETGAVRIWWVEVDGERYRSHAGQLDGSITVSEWTKCEYKNRGRSNEVSPEEQAIKEALALYTKKSKRGYTDSVGRIDTAKASLISPMLAHKYQDHWKKLVFPVYLQPKLDGIRCIARADGLWSRKGEPITTVPHIEQLVVGVCKRRNICLDGELYNHDLRDDFNSIASLVRREKCDEKHAKRVRDVVQYHVYDAICPGNFNDRWTLVQELFRNVFEEDFPIITPVTTIYSPHTEHLDETYGQCIQAGYEGAMIRTNDEYHHKRSASLLKRKEFQDAEFEIIGVVEGKGNRSGMVGALAFHARNGKQFTAALMGTDEYRRRVWKDRESYLGVDATVKYFHETPDGLPRFPVVKSIDEGK